MRLQNRQEPSTDTRPPYCITAAGMVAKKARARRQRTPIPPEERARRKKESQRAWIEKRANQRHVRIQTRRSDELQAPDYELIALTTQLNTSEAWARAEQRITALYGCGTSWRLLEKAFKYFHAGQK